MSVLKRANSNETSCYCDNEDFATDVKVCLYQYVITLFFQEETLHLHGLDTDKICYRNCSSYVPVFYNYRASICGTSNSSEYYSSIAAANPTAGLASSTASGAAATAATGTSAVSPSSTADSNAGAKVAAAVWGLGAVAVILSYNLL